jgi:kynurenine formamidase
VKIVDISVQLQENMPRYPSPYLPPVTLTPVARHETEARSAQVLNVGTHVSTHVDAPFHAVPGGRTIDEIQLDRWFGLARVLRFGDRDKDSPLDVSDFASIDGLADSEKIILDTGWSRRTWGGADYFIEGPFLTRAASQMLAGLSRLHLIGMDFPNIDAAGETVVSIPAPNHRIVLGREIILLENLIKLDEIDDVVVLLAAPPRLVGGDGCPVRALAVFPIDDLRFDA